MQYAWDFPAVERKKIYISCNKRSRKIDIMEIGVLPPLKVSLKIKPIFNILRVSKAYFGSVVIRRTR